LKLLFDNNLSLKLSQVIQSLFPGSKHVFELNLDDLPDIEIWQYAKANNFSIVTKDRDFYYLASTSASQNYMAHGW
jgi:predicted nuclease of predicted toxin-antitoxin system